MTSALEGLRVLDLSRILAGPSCAQLLGDLGADVVKVERPHHGDDTRRWGPPFDAQGDATYFLAANRNKRSIEVDLGSDAGAALIRDLAAHADVLIENYKTGDLTRRGLGPTEMLRLHPKLIYASISGFGSDGPRAHEPGYDFLAQAMGGLMSVTGPKETPMKAGVGVADLFTGMNAAVGILAALRHRDRTGEGQHIEVALLDAQLAMMANVATDAFLSGRTPERLGNGHPHIVPYQVFPCEDGHIVVAVGNDAQWLRYRALLDEVAPTNTDLHDEVFAKNQGRVAHRAVLIPRIEARMRLRTRETWMTLLRAHEVPVAPVHTVLEAFDDPQAKHRQMRIQVGEAELIACPIHASVTPPTYRLPPPALGAHTREVVTEWLGWDAAAVEAARELGAFG
jgi:crotonobetainyl-CoA:carnitine CoA-transferase CaiB-like acyl-CoA transferase